MGALLDLHGVRFGRLVVIAPAEHAKNGKTQWLCRCDCGRETIVKTNALRNGDTKSCGCLVKDASSLAHTKHGMSDTRLYRVWKGIKNRCGNPNAEDYQHYGGRGITVCPEWDTNYETFRDWALANGYQAGLTIERNNVNGNYCPENCRWATRREQALNKTNNHLLTYEGITMPLTKWAEKIGLPADVLFKRKRQGWSDAKTIETPLLRQKGRHESKQ